MFARVCAQGYCSGLKYTSMMYVSDMHWMDGIYFDQQAARQRSEKAGDVDVLSEVVLLYTF